MSSRAGSDYDWTISKHIDSNQENVIADGSLWQIMPNQMNLLEIVALLVYARHFKEKGLKVKGIELSDEFVPFLKSRGYEIFFLWRFNSRKL